MVEYIQIKNKADCTGCSACYSVCPCKAISMAEDAEGFLYPQVDAKACVNCGMCVRVCPQKQAHQPAPDSEYLALKHLGEGVREKSTSGGAFTLLANYVLEKEGAVYGASFDEAFMVRHQRAVDESWKAFRGAKYVQSTMGDVFSSVKKDLQENKWVLFSGTPCQVYGLVLFLDSKKIKRDTLITCDLVCHGAPSPKVWRDYLYLDGLSEKKIGSVYFRDKRKKGWHQSRLQISDKHGNVIVDTEQVGNVYGKCYFNGYSLRPSCYACRYTNFNRVGDFTIGDFWGIEKHYPDFDDNKGTSLLMVNTPKARSIYQEVCGDVEAIRVTQEECVQPNLQEPSSCYGDRNAFWEQYHRGGLIHACKFVGLLPVTGLEKYCYFVHRKWVAICNRIKRYC